MSKSQKRQRARKHVLLSHHSHTGKHLPHEHTSYTLLIGLIMYVGIVMVMMSRSVAAIDYSVNASVKGIPPTSPAVILSPVNGAEFNSEPQLITGSCPLDSYVKIYRNNVLGGSAICTLDNTFQLSVDLFEGTNELIARVFNTTDDEGPMSSPVTVTYVAPLPPKPVPSSSSARPATRPTDDPSSSEPFLITADVKYQGHYIKQEVDWEFEIIGGTAPYNVSIEWGDGSGSNVTIHKPGKFTVPHVYKHTGGFKGSFLIKVKIKDVLGQTSYLEVFAIINNILQSAKGGAGSASTSLPGSELGRYLWIIWPLYFLLLLRIISLWLAERHRPNVVKKRNGPRHLKPHHS